MTVNSSSTEKEEKPDSICNNKTLIWKNSSI